MNPSIVCFALLFFFWLLPKAQDIHQDIAQINESYAKYTWLEMKTEYRWYSSPSASEPEEKIEGLIQNSPKGQYKRLGSMESLLTERYAIAVNHEEKVVMMQHAPTQVEISPLDIPLDTILLLCQNYKYETVKGKPSWVFEINPDVADNFEKIRMVFNPQTYLVEKLVLYPARDSYAPEEQSRLEIDFLQIKTTANLSTSFSESRYVFLQDGTWRLKADYQDYRLLTLLEE